MDFYFKFLYDFIIYGYAGWGLENLFSYCKTGHMQNDGFLYSPFKPMYALTMSSIIYINEKFQNYYLLALICLIIPTTVEFITGVIMRRYFNKDYWDYSNIKHNYKGLICLEFSLYWFILALFVIGVIQPFIVELIYLFLKPIWKIIIPIQVIILIIDFFMTVRSFLLKRKFI